MVAKMSAIKNDVVDGIIECLNGIMKAITEAQLE